MALSVDAPAHSQRLIERLGLSFDLGSDSDQKVIQAFGIQNPDTQELALHAVYILGTDDRILYRKVASRRPTSNELIDAIDAYQGTYPQSDERSGRPQRVVAYPSNNFQTLIEMANVESLPATVDAERLDSIVQQLKAGNSDDSIIAFRRYIASANDLSAEQRLIAASWLARQVFIANQPSAITTGKDLSRRLSRVAELQTAHQAATTGELEDALLHKLAAARGGLARVRATVTKNESAWNLRYAQGMLRGYREVAQER